MKFISYDQGWVLQPYFEYLVSVRDQMPAHIHRFATDYDNYHLHCPNSLHDAWIETWRIGATAIGPKRGDRRIDIDACLLGQMHDRYIHLRYIDVQRHTIAANDGACYGDLLIHELTIERQGVYAHELLFAGGAVITAHFKDFQHSIEMFSENTLP